MKWAEMILMLLLLAAPAWAAHEQGMVGPYNVSFDMNTTMNYVVKVDKLPSSGITASGIDFIRYNATIQSTDYYAWLILTRYNDSMLASINANAEIVQAALQGSVCDKPEFFQPIIDGQPGYLGRCKTERLQIGPESYEQGALIVVASYSPDAAVQDNGEYRGRTDCRIISTYPWETTRDLLYTLQVEAPKAA